MHRRPGLAGLAPAAMVGGEDARDRGQPPDPVLTGADADIAELVGEEPVPESGVVSVDAQEHVDDMGVVVVPLGHRGFEPLVVPLGRWAQDPARHRDRHPDPLGITGTGRGKFTDEREDHFPGRFACDSAARRRTSFSCSRSRIRFLASRSSTRSASLRPGRFPSSMSARFNQLLKAPSEIPKSLAI
jgi:hypothetical protein